MVQSQTVKKIEYSDWVREHEGCDIWTALEHKDGNTNTLYYCPIRREMYISNQGGFIIYIRFPVGS